MRSCADGDLDDGAYAEAVEQLGAAGLFELLTLVGYYATLALQLRVFRVVRPRPEPRSQRSFRRPVALSRKRLNSGVNPTFELPRRSAAMKLVTFDDGRVGRLDGRRRRRARLRLHAGVLRARRPGRRDRGAARRSPTCGCGRRSCRRSSSTPPATSPTTTRSSRPSTGRTRCTRASCSSRTSTRSSARTTRSSTRRG